MEDLEKIFDGNDDESNIVDLAQANARQAEQPEPEPENPADSPEPTAFTDDQRQEITAWTKGKSRDDIRQAVDAAIYDRLEQEGLLPDEPTGEAAEGPVAAAAEPNRDIAQLQEAIRTLAAQNQQLMQHFQPQEQQGNKGNPDIPDPLFDHEGYQAYMRGEVENMQNKMRIQTSFANAAGQYGEDVARAAVDMADQTGMGEVFQNQPDPVGAAIKYMQGQQILQTVGSTPEEFEGFIGQLYEHALNEVREQAKEAGLNEVKDQLQNLPAALKQDDIPPSIAGKGGANTEPPVPNDDEFFNQLYAS